MANGLRIAFGYKAHSGKDTCAEYLKEKHGGVILKFADGIYNILYTVQDMMGIPRKKHAPLLQMIGTDLGRNADPDVWVKICTNRIKEILKENPEANILISDLRFPNEASSLKELGFTLCCVTRKQELRGNIGRDPNHPSETAMDWYDKWDVVIENNGTLEDLYKKVDQLIKN